MTDRDPYQQQSPGGQGQSQAAPAEPCRGCGVPLALDQRYCLNCGLRRGDPRLDFRRHSQAPGAATQEAPAAAAPAATDGKSQRDFAPLAAVGGVAVLGLMLLIGVLIGRGDDTASAPAPAQVVRVQDEGTGSTASEESTGKDKSKDSSKKSKAKVSGKKAEDANSLTSGNSGSGPVVASDDALQELEENSGSSYSENSAKLPDEIATGGEAPPTDNKAPGGGSAGTAIE